MSNAASPALPPHTASDFTPAPRETWNELPRTMAFAVDTLRSVRITAWTEAALYAPSRSMGAEIRVKVVCGDCNGDGITEHEYCANRGDLEPSYAHAECDHCGGEGEHASELDGDAADKLWLYLTTEGLMSPEVRAAAEARSAEFQAGVDADERAWAERNAEAAQ